MRVMPVVTIVAALAAPALAQDATLHESDGRYTYRPAESGTLRLDTRTGQVALCTRQDAGWSCNVLPDARAAYEQEIARLQDENAALRKSLAEAQTAAKSDEPRAGEPKIAEPQRSEPKSAEPRSAEPKSAEPKNAEPGTDPKSDEPKLRLPSQAEIDRMMGVLEKMWRRMIEMVGSLQRDMEKI
jgi:hypothetical protein